MFFGIFTRKDKNDSLDQFELSRSLIKTATQLKKTNIEEAIKNIRQAIDICPEKVFQDYYKLANYIQITGHHDEAFSILAKLLSDLDPQNYHMFNMNRSSIGEKMTLHLFREKKFEDCIWHGCEADWNRFVAFSCQGRFSGTNGCKLFLEGRNAIKAFKEIGRIDEIDSFKEIFREFLLDYYQRLIELSKLSPGLSGKKPTQKYITVYKEMNGDVFPHFFKNELEPFIRS